MANTLRVKRRASGSPGAPTSLENAELAFNEVDNILYIGKGAGGTGGSATTIEAIAGDVKANAHNAVLTGTPTAPTASPGTGNTQIATTAYVDAAVTGSSVSDGNKGDITVSGGGATWTINTSAFEAAPISDDTQDALDLKIDLSEKGAASGVATLDSNSKIPVNQLPAIAISETFVVASEAAMLALDAQVGDVAIRTDISTTFILAATPATTLGNWEEMLSPGGGVTSVDVDGGTTGLTTSGGPVTSTGTITLSGTLAVANGGTGATTASAGRTNLGLGTIAVQDADDVAITGGTIDNITIDGGTF